MESSSNDNSNPTPSRYIRSTTARFNAEECKYILKAFRIALDTIGSYQDFGNPVIIRRIEGRLLHRLESDKLNRIVEINPQLELSLQSENDSINKSPTEET